MRIVVHNQDMCGLMLLGVKAVLHKLFQQRGLFSLIFNFQVLSPTHYSMVFYLVTRELVPRPPFASVC